MNTISIAEQINAVMREIGMRQRMYPKWIEQKRLTEIKASYEIACMEAVLETLAEAQRNREPSLL